MVRSLPYLLIFLGLILTISLVSWAAAPLDDLNTLNITPHETPPKIAITPIPTIRIPIGEVVFPITPRVTERPTIPETTPSPSKTPPQTTLPVSHTVSPTTEPRTPVVTSPRPTLPAVSGTTPSPTVTVTTTTVTTAPETSPILYYRSGPIFSPYYTDIYTPGSSAGTLIVTSVPSGAVVTLDGYNAETTPYMFTGVSPGYHTVEVDYPGYGAYIQNVYIEGGSGMEINADLIDLGSYGSMYIDSTPQGADAFVDGNHEGTTPVRVGAISPGAHQVELHLAGYEVLSTTEYVTEGQETTVNLVLVPYSTTSDTGSIGITSSVSGALVYLDGIYKGSLPSGNPFNIVSVDPGTHTLLLHLPGYLDVTQTVDVYPGQVSNVNAVFTPSSQTPQGVGSSAATGTLTISSVPSGGEVYVDSQFRGITPVNIFNVAPGNHIVNLKLSGYNDFSTSVDLQPNQVTQVIASFQGGPAKPVATRAGLSFPVILIGIVLGIAVIAVRDRK